MHIVSDHIRASDWNQQKIRYDWNYDSKYYKMSEGNLNTLSVAAARFVMKKKWMNRLFWIQKVQSVQMWFFLKMWFFWRNFLKFDFFLNRQLTLLPKKSRNRINKKPTEEKTKMQIIFELNAKSNQIMVIVNETWLENDLKF